jgi:serine protease AprX
MFDRTRRSTALVFGVLLFVLLAGGMAGAAVQEGPRLRLHRGDLDARRAGGPAVAAERENAAFRYVQFGGPTGASEVAALQATGVTVLEYVPEHAFLVRGTPEQLLATERLPGVYATAAFASADKLAPALLGALAEKRYQGALRLTVRSWAGQERELAVALSGMGIDPAQPIDVATLRSLIQLEAVRWIEPAEELRLLNDRSRDLIGVAPMWQQHQLFGAGQVLGVADSGLDSGDLATISPDFAGRIVATHVLAPDGDLADEAAHGTHVTGSAAGSGVRSGADPAIHTYGGSLAGVAPEASLVIQAFEVDENGIIAGLADDPYPIFEQAYASGARVHTNSWGGYSGIPFFEPERVFGGYPLKSQRTDQFLWEHQDMAIFFAAGNSGVDGMNFLVFGCYFPDGVINEDSLVSPGTAKNAITVGASESNRGSQRTWRSINPSCYDAEPIASDTISDDPNGMAAFSSRGPVDDGRIKPDLVAPGTSILSSRSAALVGDFGTPTDAPPGYVYASGTSMATPIAAGAGVLVREWLTRQGLTNPSGAAVKAVLLNTTRDLAPGQYGTEAKQEIPFSRPNSVAGWGRVDLRFLSDASTTWVDDRRSGLATGTLASYAGAAGQPLTVQAGSGPLRVMLAWTDPPASLSAAKQLVNDLDLVVTGPDGVVYWGNKAAGGDRVNNVEGVIIAQPAAGAYTIEVRGYNVPVSTQPYALAVTGPLVQARPTAPAPPPIYFPAVSGR